MAIKLTRDENVVDVSNQKAAPSTIQYKASYKYDDRWKPIKPEDLFDVKIGELWKEEKRIMVECLVQGKTMYFVSNDIDYDAMKRKYPKECVVHILQLVRLWTGVMDEKYVMKVLPKVLMALTHFDGAKVVDVKR